MMAFRPQYLLHRSHKFSRKFCFPHIILCSSLAYSYLCINKNKERAHGGCAILKYEDKIEDEGDAPRPVWLAHSLWR